MFQRVIELLQRPPETCAASCTPENRASGNPIKLPTKRSAFCALLLAGLISIQWTLPLTGQALSLNPDNSSLWSRPSYERKMNEIGNKILTANNIQTPILFRMSETPMLLDAQAESKHHLILVGSALFPMVSTDDELAAILSHEIAHIITGKSGHLAGGQISLLDILGTVIFVPEAILTTMSMGQSIKQRLGRATLQNRETAMDLIGIDLMVKAGYNPTAMETILREIATDNGNKHWRSRITITERLKRIHAAIALKYPEALPLQERTPAPQEHSPDTTPTNTVSAPADSSLANKDEKAATEATHASSTGQNETSTLEDAPQILAPTTTSVLTAPPQKEQPAQADAIPTQTLVKAVLPKQQPKAATKAPPVQHLLDQNGQPMPTTPPGVPAALKPAS